MKVIERSGQFYGGGVNSRPKVAPVPKGVAEKLGRRVCKVLLVDSKNVPEDRNIFERARQSHSLYSSRRMEVLSEGLKTLKKLASTPTQDQSSKMLTGEKMNKVGMSFKWDIFNVKVLNTFTINLFFPQNSEEKLSELT